MTGSKLIKKAKTYLGKGWSTFCKKYGYNYAVPWCCIWVWYIFKACKASNLFYGSKKVCNCRVAFNWCNANLKKVKMADAKAGDIVFFTWTGRGNNTFNSRLSIDHIGFIRGGGTSNTAYTIEGNTLGSTPSVSKVAERTRAKAYVLGIFRPKYKAETKTETKVETSSKIKGIDISYWQGKISVANFKKAKNAGWKFAIIRIGYNRNLNKDSVFENNYKNALAAGLKVGVYYYSTALTVEQAKAEANYTLKLLKGRKLTYPVFIDFEDACQAKLGKDKSRKICEAFCQVIEKAGYPAGVYASYNYLTNKIAAINKKYYVWLAQYPKSTYKGRYELHQYSSATPVPGIGSKIDVDTSELKGGTYPKKTETKTVTKAKTKTETKKTETKKKKVRVYPELPKRGFFTLGDKGVNVKRLQTLLKKAGYNVGALDGIYGNKTASAVRSFQKKHKLTVDGCWGKKSQNALKKALK